MSNRRAFEIAFVGLKPGVHEFYYEVDDKFFVPYGEQDFANCKATVTLKLEKNNGFMQLFFDVGGTVEVLCDRCGNTLEQALWDEFKMLVKLVDEPEAMNASEEDPDVFYISRTESHLQLADWIFEFVTLSVPLQRHCSEDEMGGTKCNQEVLDKLKQMENEVANAPKAIWKGLDKIKGLDT
ncbi:MAG: YceD family protein [Chitinophagaceae bacterium]